MATERQIAANRANAQSSTGPRTTEGKAASSTNSLRHGLAARGLIVLPGQEHDFDELEDGLRTSLTPHGTLQETIFKCILESAWNRHRCSLAEAQLYSTATDLTIDPLLDSHNEAKYARIQKYARQSESSMFKALRELSTLQTEHQYRHEAYPLSQQQLDDLDQFEQTPHSLSQACRFEKVMASVNRQQTAESTNRRVEANSVRRNLVAQVKAVGPPPRNGECQIEANQPESVRVAAAA